MNGPNLIYRAPPTFAWDAIERVLEGGLKLRAEQDVSATRRYLDTFDWRLFRIGTVLEALATNGGRWLRWRALHGGEILLERRIEADPRFAADLGAGARARRLARRIGIRALLPVATVRGRLVSARVLDTFSKTVVRLELWAPAPSRSTANGVGLEPTLLVMPVRGYTKPLERLQRVLEGALGLEATPSDPLLELTAGSERPPADYSHSHSLQLDPRMPTVTACKAILRELLAVMRENEPGLRADVDTEFLHDYRVAVRRTRSLLGQVKGVFPARRRDPVRRGYAWLQEVTGPVRDLDVYLLHFEDLRGAVPPSLQADLDPLREFLAKRRMAAFETMLRALESSRYRRLIAGWGRFLDQPDPRHSSLANAARPIGEVAGERIWRMYKRSLAEGCAIDESSPAEALHDLRKTCKKLRYLLEFFRSLYPSQHVGRLIKRLKNLQDNLGSFQDVEVQRDALGEIKQSMADQGALSPRTALAIDLLREDFLRRHQALRGAFAQCFAEYASKSNRSRIKALLVPSKATRAA